MDVNDQLFVYSHLTALKHITPPSHCCSLCYELCCLNGFPPLEELWAGSVERHLMAAKWIHTQIRRGLQTQQSNNSCQREREREREREGGSSRRGESEKGPELERKVQRCKNKWSVWAGNEKKSVPCYLASQQVRRCVGENRTGSDISCEEIYWLPQQALFSKSRD